MATMLDAPSLIVLYDGDCGFCDASVRWLLDHDTAGRLRFAALQGQTADRLRQTDGRVPTDLDTMVLVEGEGTELAVYLRSRAVLRICRWLGRPWRWLSVLALLPTWLTDPPYRLFARHRYLVGGKVAACRLPAPGERLRFLP
jgi:predicted DCC family thiol-disulfide oxidoreductase YuxK